MGSVCNVERAPQLGWNAASRRRASKQREPTIAGPAKLRLACHLHQDDGDAATSQLWAMVTYPDGARPQPGSADSASAPRRSREMTASLRGAGYLVELVAVGTMK